MGKRANRHPLLPITPQCSHYHLNHPLHHSHYHLNHLPPHHLWKNYLPLNQSSVSGAQEAEDSCDKGIKFTIYNTKKANSFFKTNKYLNQGLASCSHQTRCLFCKVLLQYNQTYLLQIIYGCFGNTMAELSN